MHPFLNWLWRLMHFNASPNELPHVKQLLVSLLLINIIVLVLGLITYLTFFHALLVGCYLIASEMLLLYSLLWMKQRTERFFKTLSAMLFVSIFFQIIRLPILTLLVSQLIQTKLWLILFELFLILLQIWLVLIHAYLLRCALNVGRLTSLAFVFAMSLIQFQFMGLFINL